MSQATGFIGVIALIYRISIEDSCVHGNLTEKYAAGVNKPLNILFYIGAGGWLISASINYFRYHFFDAQIGMDWLWIWEIGQIGLAIFISGVRAALDQ